MDQQRLLAHAGDAAQMSEGIETRRIISLLSDSGRAKEPRRFPESNVESNYPGLYAWWADSTAVDLFTRVVGSVSPDGCIYVGQTGATKWPSGKTSKATLRNRILGNHIRGNVRSSTFRWTISAILFRPLKLRLANPNRLRPEDNRKVSDWIKNHLRVAIAPYADRDSLGKVERDVLKALDPPLCLQDCPTNEFRQRLSDLRKRLTVCDG